MSRLEQSTQGDLIRNPAARFLEFKNMYTKEEVVLKGKKKEIKVFEKCGFNYSEKVGEEWVQHFVDLPLEFAVLNGDWVNFKGWNETEKCKYWSNEVKNADDTISIRNKEGIVYEFTLNDKWGKVAGSKVKDELLSKKVNAALKGLNVKQHSSIYIGLKNEDDGSFELVNLQLKGANLSGVRENEDKSKPSGWWNFSKKYKQGNALYSKFVQVNDYTVEDGELGEYGVLNWEMGSKIGDEDNEKLEELFNQLEEYHKFYLNKPKVVVEETKAELVTTEDDDDNAIYDEDGNKLF